MLDLMRKLLERVKNTRNDEQNDKRRQMEESVIDNSFWNNYNSGIDMQTRNPKTCVYLDLLNVSQPSQFQKERKFPPSIPRKREKIAPVC